MLETVFFIALLGLMLMLSGGADLHHSKHTSIGWDTVYQDRGEGKIALGMLMIFISAIIAIIFAILVIVR